MLALSYVKPADAAAGPVLLVIGDSLVAGYGLEAGAAFPARLEARLHEKGHDITVVSAGVSGETTSGLAGRLAWVLETLETGVPDYAIVVTGGNDMLRAVPLDVTRKNLEKIADILRQNDVAVLLAGMRSFRNLSLFGDRFQDVYKDVAAGHDFVLYPFFLKGVALESRYNQPDGIHPNAAGVEVIVDNILPRVEKLLKKKKG